MMSEEITEYVLTEKEHSKKTKLLYRFVNPVTCIRFEIRTCENDAVFILNTGKDIVTTTIPKLLAKVAFWSAYNDGRTRCKLNADPLSITIEEKSNMMSWRFNHSLANLPHKAFFFTPRTSECSLHGLHALLGGNDDDKH